MMTGDTHRMTGDTHRGHPPGTVTGDTHQGHSLGTVTEDTLRGTVTQDSHEKNRRFMRLKSTNWLIGTIFIASTVQSMEIPVVVGVPVHSSDVQGSGTVDGAGTI